MGTGGCEGLQTRVAWSAGTTFHTYYQVGRNNSFHYLRRGGIPPGERSSASSGEVDRGFLFKNLCSTKERRKVQTSHQPQALESLHGIPALQDGRYSGGKGIIEGRRLDDPHRPQRCIFRSPHSPEASQVSEVYMEGQGLRVQMPPLWALHSPKSLHKASSSGCKLPPTEGSPLRDIPGRHTVNGAVQNSTPEAYSNGSDFAAGFRFPDQLSKVPFRAHPDTGVPGLHNRLDQEGAETPQGEVGGNQEASEEVTEAGQSFSKNLSPVPGQIISSDTGSAPSPTTLQKLAEAQAQSLAGKGLRWGHQDVSGSQRGPSLVVGQPTQMEWEEDASTQPRGYHRNGCIMHGMGCFLPGRDDRRMLESGGEKATYQLARAPSSILCPEGIPEADTWAVSPDIVGQYDRCSICEQDGGDKIGSSYGPHKGNMELVHRSFDRDQGSTPTREAERHSGLSIQISEGPNRLDVESGIVRSDRRVVGTNTNGPLCFTLFSTAGTFLQLAGRPRSGSNGCIHAGLGREDELCASTLVPDHQGIAEGAGRKGDYSPDHPPVDITALVPSNSGFTDRSATATPSRQECTHPITELRLPSSNEQSIAVGRMEGLRRRFQSDSIPEKAIELIMCSWREKTNANYNSAWRKWEEWCRIRNTCAFSADIQSILAFLADEFEKGKQYRSLNCYRSALSSAHLPIEGFQVGQHPLVSRLLKGAFNLRPPQPRYSQTWNVAQLLAHVRGWGDNEKLSLRQITKKVAILLALVLAHRASDLVRLSLRGSKHTQDGIVLQCVGLAKQARQGNFRTQEVFIAGFREKSLCPVTCLQVYEQVTSGHRKSERLFLATVSPYRPVTSSSIARWIKDTLRGAGLGEYNAHSSRGAAATAAAMSGVSIQEILNRAGWSKEDTFSRFYYRPKEAEKSARSFGEGVLGYEHAKDRLIEPEPSEVQSQNG